MLCQGEMEKGTAPFHIDRKGYHLTLDRVPAWICRQCGEVHFGEHEIDSIQGIIQKLETGTNKLFAA
ncbi:MAG: YgiT-type zinc finger protein [Thermodesulfobacteriota bacterium]